MVPCWENENILFANKQVIGKHKLRDIFSDMGQAIGIIGLTGHSFRRSGVQKLQESGIPEQIIAKKKLVILIFHICNHIVK